MKALILFLALAAGMSEAKAADIYLFGGLFAYDDNSTKHDYQGISPNGYYGIKAIYHLSPNVFLEVGAKHESSTAYREVGKGFNGVFTTINFKL